MLYHVSPPSRSVSAALGAEICLDNRKKEAN